MRKLLYDFSRLRDADLSPTSQHIISKMTGNSFFATPKPALTVIQTALNAYNTSLAKAKSDGSRADFALKDQNREALEKLMSQLADYVEDIALGDEVKLESSGFDLAKTPEKRGPLEKPENLKVAPGANKGTLEISVDAVKNAMMYEVQYKLTGENVWQTVTYSKRKYTIENLASGKQYLVRVAAAGTDPSRIWTDEITTFVL